MRIRLTSQQRADRSGADVEPGHQMDHCHDHGHDDGISQSTPVVVSFFQVLGQREDSKLAINRQEQVKVQNADPGQPHKKPIKSFALQVGTFASNENAEKMRDQMREAGYTAFVHKSTSKGKTSYKVRVGPELERSVLEKIKSDLKKSRKIDAYIVNHP